MSSNRLQSPQQGNQKIHMAHAQSRGHIFQIEWSHIFHHFGPMPLISLHPLGQVIYTQDSI